MYNVLKLKFLLVLQREVNGPTCIEAAGLYINLVCFLLSIIEITEFVLRVCLYTVNIFQQTRIKRSTCIKQEYAIPCG